jgi:hypothetical protein
MRLNEKAREIQLKKQDVPLILTRRIYHFCFKLGKKLALSEMESE